MENFKQVITEITDSVKQRSVSRKDEVTVMKALINDTDNSVEIFSKDGTSTYYPSQEFRKVVANAISYATKIPIKEATELANTYEFTKSDAQTMVNVSKEFVNSYVRTGRKLSLGGRADSEIELMWKTVPERTSPAFGKDGKSKEPSVVPEHGGIRAINKCPVWIKKK